jgi:hypothetical protein
MEAIVTRFGTYVRSIPVPEKRMGASAERIRTYVKRIRASVKRIGAYVKEILAGYMTKGQNLNRVHPTN